MLIFLLGLIRISFQFNLDTQSVHLLKSDNGLFGFTVALHNMSSEGLILVGSPNAQTGLDGVTKGGAVFKCPIPSLRDLEPEAVECTSTITFDEKGNEYYNRYGDKSTVKNDIYSILAEDKSHEFLGVSMATSNSHVAVCAHRYEFRPYMMGRVSKNVDLPQQKIGRCLVIESDLDDSDPSNIRVFKPCDNNEDTQYEAYGYCQAGVSVSLYGNNLVIGDPGRHKALGGGFLYDLGTFDESVEMIDILSANSDTTYLGYSSVTCNMDGNDSPDDGGLEMIFGGPRGEMYYGEIRIFTTRPGEFDEPIVVDGMRKFDRYKSPWGEDQEYNFKGEQIGSYYGHSLLCLNIDGDEYDDLIVGAPWYTDYTSSDILADTGRIYVMRGSDGLEKVEHFENPQKITGGQANAAFGFALANGGDMNDDGFLDVFVGAPYHDDGTGAVFLYLGGADGLQNVYSQIIKPSMLNVVPPAPNGIKTFGWSISGGKDMDGNGYPDVAIGAFKSGHVAYIRSKSVIDVEPQLIFSVVEFSDTQQETSLQVCLEFKKHPERDDPSVDEIPIQYTITLDGDNFRLSFESDSKVKVWKDILSVSIKDAGPLCTSAMVIHYDNSTGNVQPLPVSLSAVIHDPQKTLTSLVLNQELIINAATDLTIQSMCDPETGKCTVDLAVEVDSAVYFDESNLYPTVVFGYVKSFTKMITLSNIRVGDYSYVYNAAVNVSFSPEMRFASLAKSSDVNCQVLTETFIHCKLLDDGPINADGIKSHTFGLEFDIPDITNHIELVMNVTVDINKPTEDVNEENDVVEAVIEVKELADLAINGGATQSKIPFNNKYTVINKAIGSPDLDVKHEYSVELSESALLPEVEDVTIVIFWPQEVKTKPNVGVNIVPLYNISTARTPESVQVSCTPDAKTISTELYPSPAGNKESLAVTDELELPAQKVTSVEELPKHMSCVEDRSKCLQITCKINPIKRGVAYLNGFKISLHAKVHEANLHDSKGINITSYAKITGVLEGMELPIKRDASATTELYPSMVKSQNLVWIIIGAVIGGLLFLFLLILALWKLGFFKRKQPPSVRADKVDEQIDMTSYNPQ